MMKIFFVAFLTCVFSSGGYADVSSVTYVDKQVETVSKSLDEYKSANDQVVASKADADDPKFNAIPTSRPTGELPDGYVYIWIE